MYRMTKTYKCMQNKNRNIVYIWYNTIIRRTEFIVQVFFLILVAYFFPEYDVQFLIKIKTFYLQKT